MAYWARKLGGVLLTCAVLPSMTASASAAITLGETGTTTVVCDGPASYVQTVSTPPGYVVPPGGGVITGWATNAVTGGGQVRLALFRATGVANQYATTAASAPETLEANSLNSFSTSIPAQAGDLLGFLILSGGHNCVLLNAGTSEDRGVRQVGTVFDVGTIGDYSEPSQPNRRLNLSATLEADADGDGIGDEPPTTKITKGPPARVKDGKAKFEFVSNDPTARFECKLDSGRYKRCSSPRKYSVDEGKHAFSVRAIDADGHRDPSPAKDRFKVV